MSSNTTPSGTPEHQFPDNFQDTPPIGPIIGEVQSGNRSPPSSTGIVGSHRHVGTDDAVTSFQRLEEPFDEQRDEPTCRATSFEVDPLDTSNPQLNAHVGSGQIDPREEEYIEYMNEEAKKMDFIAQSKWNLGPLLYSTGRYASST